MTTTQIRESLLVNGLGKPVPLNAVDWKIKHHNPSASAAEVQGDTLEMSRGLADDGLVRLGAVRKHRFIPSRRPLNRSMHRISRHYVDHYDNPKAWMFSTWMALTDEGRRVALSLEQRTFDSYRDSWAGIDRCNHELPQSASEQPLAELKQLRRQVDQWQTNGDFMSRNVA